VKKYLVIGNPIEHSLSPLLHNYWIKNKNINAIYEKKRINENEIKNIILQIKQEKITGINVTVPFKNLIITHLDQLSFEAEKTESVNTVLLEKGKIVGHNTDIEGFERSIKDTGFDVVNKEILILGAGGVVPSIIFALKKMKVSKIILSNRTKDKAENLKNLFNDLQILDWGKVIKFDMIINATSVGLKENDMINLNFSDFGKNKFFYDVIYNPQETNFLRTGKKLGSKVENGKMMFVYQASAAFKIWHGTEPKINNDVINLLNR
jgi:shikimate dehydrogenase